MPWLRTGTTRSKLSTTVGEEGRAEERRRISCRTKASSLEVEAVDLGGETIVKSAFETRVESREPVLDMSEGRTDPSAVHSPLNSGRSADLATTSRLDPSGDRSTLFRPRVPPSNPRLLLRLRRRP